MDLIILLPKGVDFILTDQNVAMFRDKNINSFNLIRTTSGVLFQ